MMHAPTTLEQVTNILTREFNPDVIIIEGDKHGNYPKVAVGSIRSLKNTVMRNPELDRLLRYIERSVITERMIQLLPGLDCHRCGLDCNGLADAIASGKKRLSDCRELPDIDVNITVGNKRIHTGRFAADVADKTVRGMLSSFKGYEPGKDVEIRLGAKKASSKKVRKPR